MARKKYEEESENHERWLISYADFITLLFALFVVLYAISSVNEGKYRVLSSSLVSAFGKAPVVSGVSIPESSVLIPPPVQRPRMAEGLRRERARMTRIARDILKVLAPLVSEGKVRVTQTS